MALVLRKMKTRQGFLPAGPFYATMSTQQRIRKKVVRLIAATGTSAVGSAVAIDDILIGHDDDGGMTGAGVD